MIELKRDNLIISFPEVHEDAVMSLEFQRTLRIPDDDAVHYLPPGLGSFPMRHVDDFTERVPGDWCKHGGVMLPMFQSEAMWVNFDSLSEFPFLVKIAAGKINAVTGNQWQDRPVDDPQDYMVVPTQPWLDGYCVEKGEIRQFVAMPLGRGYTAEEQITGETEHGGLQVIAFPMKAAAWEKMKKARRERSDCYMDLSCNLILECGSSMGLAAGGRMKQEIYDDPHDFQDWDLDHGSRCFVHIANSISWRAITGEAPPTMPPTAKDYTKAGLKWFDYYAPENEAVPGSKILKGVKSVLAMGKDKGEKALPENEPIDVSVGQVVKLGGKVTPDQVREGW